MVAFGWLIGLQLPKKILNGDSLDQFASGVDRPAPCGHGEARCDTLPTSVGYLEVASSVHVRFQGGITNIAI